MIDPFVKYGGVGEIIDLSNGYLVVMQHPVTDEHHRAREQINETLHAINGIGIANPLVLAKRGCRIRWHLRGNSFIP